MTRSAEAAHNYCFLHRDIPPPPPLTPRSRKTKTTIKNGMHKNKDGTFHGGYSLTKVDLKSEVSMPSSNIWLEETLKIGEIPGTS